MKTFCSPLVLLGALFFVVQLVFGVPLVPVTTDAISTTGPASIVAGDAVVGTSKGVVLGNAALGDAVGAAVVARGVKIIPVHTNAQRQIDISPSTDQTVHPWSGPYGACFNAFELGGKKGRSQLIVCVEFGQCASFAHFAFGDVRSMGFRGATICILYTTVDCSGNKLLSIKF